MSNFLNSFSVNSFFRPIVITPFSSNFNTFLKLLYGASGDTYLIGRNYTFKTGIRILHRHNSGIYQRKYPFIYSIPNSCCLPFSNGPKAPSTRARAISKVFLSISKPTKLRLRDLDTSAKVPAPRK